MAKKSAATAQQKLVKELTDFSAEISRFNQEVQDLAKEVGGLSKEVGRLKKLEFVRVLDKPGRLMWLSFVKGMFVGLGSVIGATVLVAILIYILAQISFVPVIGDFISEVISQIKAAETVQ